GLAQSLFQVGGNVGTSLGPLFGAFLVAPLGQSSIAWCSLIALVAMVVMTRIGRWYARHRPSPTATSEAAPSGDRGLLEPRVARPIAILAALIFSKYFYLAGLNSYYTFFLISKFHLGVRAAEIDLFIFFAAVAAGTVIGGPVGDRIGVKYVIWGSILGGLPFTLLLPYAHLFCTPIPPIFLCLGLSSPCSCVLL